MRILIVNDDGINAQGIKALALRLSKNHDVTVVAPESERSAASHSITLRRPLRVSKVAPPGMEGIPCYTVDGMPVDCTKIALLHIMISGTDLVVSGINHGSNLGADIIYSGTVSAALDAVIMGYRAIAVSIDSFCPKNIDSAVEITSKLIDGGLFSGETDGILYNLNVPDLPIRDIKGLKTASQGRVIYEDALEIRRDPRGNEYIWLTGDLTESDNLEGTDAGYVEQGYASITPLKFDLTAHDHLRELDSRIEKIDLSFKKL